MIVCVLLGAVYVAEPSALRSECRMICATDIAIIAVGGFPDRGRFRFGSKSCSDTKLELNHITYWKSRVTLLWIVGPVAIEPARRM